MATVDEQLDRVAEALAQLTERATELEWRLGELEAVVGRLERVLLAPTSLRQQQVDGLANPVDTSGGGPQRAP